jgi:hypothetical protein
MACGRCNYLANLWGIAIVPTLSPNDYIPDLRKVKRGKVF